MKKLVSGCLVAASAVLLASPSMGQDGEIDGNSVQCLEYTTSIGDNATNRAMSELIDFWIVGYMTGNYSGRDNLEWSEDEDAEADMLSAVRSKCREFPTNSVAVVSESLTSRSRGIPPVASNDFNAQSYTCGDYANAGDGSAADVLKADLAEFWSWAFIQGYINASDPEMMLPLENKPTIVNAIKTNCGRMLETSYFDLTKAVANAVKPQED